MKGTAQDTGRTLDALAALPRDQQAAELTRLREASNVKPAPAIKNAFESEEDWRRALFTVWNRGAADWRERAITISAAWFNFNGTDAIGAGYPVPPGSQRLVPCISLMTAVSAVLAPGSGTVYVEVGSGATL